MKIYILGVGGVGGYFGGLLAKAGQDVTFVARGDNYTALKENGLVVKSVAGDFTIKPVNVIDDISKINSPDLIFFIVKTYDTENVAKELNKVVNENTTIITFQNGVDNDIKIQKFIDNAKVYPGLAYIFSTKISPGVIDQVGGARKLIFGDRASQDNPKLEEIEKLMKDSGVDATFSKDIESDVWKKFINICTSSGMMAMLRENIGQVLSNPETKKEFEACLREAISVAKSLNVNLPDDIFETTMASNLNTAPNSKSSMLMDIENGRQTEIETLNGTLVRLAKEKGLKVPVNEKIYKSINSVPTN